MKIGILTWYLGANYGAKLHSLALQNTVRALGHDCCFINYEPKNLRRINLRMNLNYAHFRRHPIIWYHCILRNKRFEEFTKKNYIVSAPVHNGHEVDLLGLDRVILGSDAIFNIHHPMFNSIYYGVGIEKTAKFSYAPCCEYTSVDTVLDDDIRKSLMSFTGLSVRDKKTGALIENNIPNKTTTVLDPTFLYDFRSLTPEFDYSDYILLYTFSDWSVYKQQIKEYARAHKLKILTVGRFYPWADITLDAATVNEWLAAFDNAYCVFTDSFHGLCFSIKNKKQFVIVSRPDKRDKNQELMNMLKIQKRFYEGESLEESFEQKVDYLSVEKTIGELKILSLDYLERSIKEGK